jgi:hypothetical protein
MHLLYNQFIFYIIFHLIQFYIYHKFDRLCGLVVRVPGYRSRGPGLIPGTTRNKVVGLELSSLILVSTTEEILGRNISGFGLENLEYGRRVSLR